MSEQSWLKEFYPIDACDVPERKVIKHSLVKWYGLREESLKKHGLESPPICVDGISCSLCEKYMDVLGAVRCTSCPLFQFLGKSCASFDDKNREFNIYDDTGDPEPMIAALEAIAFVEKTCK